MRVLLVGNYKPDRQFSMQRYCRQLERGLASRGITVEPWFPTVIFGRLTQTEKGMGKWLGYIDKYIFASISLWFHTLIKTPDLVHVCDHSNAHYTYFCARCPAVITCHDLIAVRSALGEFSDRSTAWSGRQQQKIILWGLAHASIILCVSGASADDLQRLLGTSCPPSEVVANGIDDSFIGQASCKVERRHNYLLHVGNDSWYKNREAVLRFFKAVNNRLPSIQLRVVGPEFDDVQLKKAGLRREMVEKIKYEKDLSDAELQRLYENAKLLIFPSRIEGFGWPIVEAQACGCPVACLDRKPMSELNALPELLLDTATERPKWADCASEKCLPTIEMDPAERIVLSKRLQAFASRYTLTNMIDATLAVYNKVSP